MSKYLYVEINNYAGYEYAGLPIETRIQKIELTEEQEKQLLVNDKEVMKVICIQDD